MTTGCYIRGAGSLERIFARGGIAASTFPFSAEVTREALDAAKGEIAPRRVRDPDRDASASIAPN